MKQSSEPKNTKYIGEPPLFKFTMGSVVVPLAVLFSAPIAFASTDVELTFGVVTYESTETTLDADEKDSDNKETKLKTLEPDLGVNIFADEFCFNFSFNASGDSESGNLFGGYDVADDLYLGLALSLNRSMKDDETKPENAEKFQTETTDNLMAVGPAVLYHHKTSDGLIAAGGIFSQVTSKSTSDDGTTENEAEIKALAIVLTASYRFKVAERFYLGSGLSYGQSLSGEADVDNGTTSINSDYAITSFGITLLDAMVEL